jgi:hypothetical protein
MTSLSQARTLANQIETATQQFEAYMRPSLQEYLDFLPERGPSWRPSKFLNAEDYSFREVDDSAFVFESEEFYDYGEDTRDVVELPFGFVSSPAAYMAETLEANRIAVEKRAAKNREAAEKRLANLKRQIVIEEAALNR